MENIIKKKINIEDTTSRVRGLIPTIEKGYYYYNEENSSWVKGKTINKDFINNNYFPFQPVFYIINDSNNTDVFENDYNTQDIFIEKGYLLKDGIMNLVIYKTDKEIYPNDADKEDAFYYVGTTQEIGDGITYDKWRKIDGERYDFNTQAEYYILTEQMVNVIPHTYSITDKCDKTNVYFSYGLGGENGEYGNWGKIPMDIYMPSEMYNFNLPFDIDDRNRKILRFFNMMRIYYWLNKFIKTSSVYRLCKRNGSLKWVYSNNFILHDYYGCYFYDEQWYDGEKNDEISVFKNLENVNISDFNIGDIIIINNSYFDDYRHIFNNTNLYNSILFYNFVEKTQGRLYIPEKIGGTLVPTYIQYYDIPEWYNWLHNNKNSEDKSIKYKYQNMGGDNMRIFLEDKISLFQDTVNEMNQITAAPYTSFNILINNKIDDMGMWNTYSQEWISGKKYYVGDTVIYISEDDAKGSSYTLKYGSGYELFKLKDFNLKEKNSYSIITNYNTLGDIYENCENIINNKESKTPHFIDDNNSKKMLYYCNNEYYLPLAYYYGYQDENTYEIYFDEINEGKLVHWERNCGKEYNEEWSGDNISEIVSHGYSKLSTFERMRKSYDDDKNELPGIILYDENNNVRKELELPYLINTPINIVNVLNKNEAVSYGDILSSVTEDGNKITFEYYIGCEFKIEDGEKYTRVENTGIKHTETYLFTKIENKTCKVDGVEYSFSYKEIDFGENKRLNISEITHNSNEFYKKNEKNDSYEYINSLLYKDDSSLGMSTPFKLNVDVNINRGNTTAYDKYYMLTEVKNIDDLEHYRNNFFNIKK